MTTNSKAVGHTSSRDGLVVVERRWPPLLHVVVQAAELDLSGAAFSRQLKRADRSGAPWAVVIGESEAEQGVVLLKDLLGGGAEQRLSPPAVLAHLTGSAS